MITQGDAKHPVRLNDHVWGPIIKEVHWGGFALLEFTYPLDFDWRFEIETLADPTAVPPVIAIPLVEIDATHTIKTFKVNDVIDRTAEDKDNPIILIKFDESNPINDITEETGFIYAGIFAEAVHFVQPHIEMIEIEPYKDIDQARLDAEVAAANAFYTAAYNASLAAEPAAIDAFLAIHPDAVIFRNVIDLRDVLPEPSGGWGENSITYIPDGQWYEGSPIPSGGDVPITLTYPGYQVFVTRSGIDLGNIPPIRVGFAYGKYPTTSTEHRDRECYIINLSKLGNRVVTIRLMQRTSNTDSSVQIDFFSGGGTWSTAAKRTVVSSTPLSPPSIPPLDPVSHMVKTTQFANGKDPLDKVIAKFDRHGFVPLT